MKAPLLLLALTLAGTACQQPAPTTQAVAAGLSAASAVSATPADSLTPGQRRLLQQRSLAVLLETPPNRESGNRVRDFNGFFGLSHRRIEVVFTEVRQDAARPSLYYLRGKNRYQGRITPFAGTLLLQRLADQPRFSAQEVARGYTTPQHNQDAMYTALGDFVLREDSTTKNAGVFRGRAAIDWWVNLQGEVRSESRTRQTLTQNGGTKFEGTWTQYGKTAPEPVVWVDDIFSYGPQILHDFSVGQRDPDFNPKYAKLGWNTYWANDEWWADSPKPAAAL